MKTHLDRSVTVVLTLAVVMMAVAIVRREFFTRTPGESAPPPPKYEPSWRRALASGTLIGDSGAAVKVVEFGDLQCPSCRRYQAVLSGLVAQFPEKVAIVFVHFPIPYHAFARGAARAAECARPAGRFGRFLEVAYEKQDSLGIKSAWSYASEAGVRDSVAFELCLEDTTNANLRIQAGIDAGTQLKVDATPTILVNGWRYEVPPSRKFLAGFVRELLDGKHAPPQ